MASTKVKAGEHPLMSNRTLRTMYSGMVRARGLVADGPAKGRERRAAMGDVGCWASVLVGVTEGDVVFACRRDGAVGALLGGEGELIVRSGIDRLYAAVGAAAALRGGKKGRVVVAFFERHEVGGARWAAGLAVGAELPLVLVVLPRWKGTETGEELCRESRGSGVPGIPVDGRDAVALYRVASESLGRARAGGGAALIEAISLEMPGDAGEVGTDAVAELAAGLERRGVASRAWIERVGGFESGARRQN